MELYTNVMYNKEYYEILERSANIVFMNGTIVYDPWWTAGVISLSLVFWSSGQILNREGSFSNIL